MASENAYFSTHIGGYHLVAELASGSFARVYVAQHTLLDERFVVLNTVQKRERFLLRT